MAVSPGVPEYSSTISCYLIMTAFSLFFINKLYSLSFRCNITTTSAFKTVTINYYLTVSVVQELSSGLAESFTFLHLLRKKIGSPY